MRVTFGQYSRFESRCKRENNWDINYRKHTVGLGVFSACKKGRRRDISY